MMIRLKWRFQPKTFLYLFLFIYFCISALYLTKFPFMHSDESWLSGLSRNMLEKGDFSVTEPFFDLKTRHPHAIKIIFHFIQIIFIRIMGYNLFTVRFVSLIFGILSLYYFYKLTNCIFPSSSFALLATLLLCIDVQFVYASHFARQEIILLFTLIYGLYFMLNHLNDHINKHDLILGSIIGISIGIHPNSFIISLPFGCIYLYHIFNTKKLKFVHLLVYVLTVGVFAFAFISISISFDPNFIVNYITYGQEEFGVLNPISAKLEEVKYFYLKLFYQVSGTYYMPNIKFQMLLFCSALIGTLIKLYFYKNHSLNDMIISIIVTIIGIHAGIIIVGRYNQTSIIFLFPLFYILVIYLLNNLSNYHVLGIVSLFIIILVTNTVSSILSFNITYDDYLDQISKAVKKDHTVLANLNTEFYFDNGKLFDYRNLAFLKDQNLTFEQYIRKNHIQYIIYPEEMDYIYNTRPRWYGLYGNLVYYEEMKKFMKQYCEEICSFTNPTYGIRISRYINTKDWKIQIYKVIN